MTFAAPWFLLAILAGAIPVVIHLINRQKAQTLPFSTLRFLQISVQRTRRRKYVHDVLLMLLRIAALVVIALALAKPTLSQLGNFLGRRAASAVAIIVDNSASMATADAGRQRWQTAVKAAEDILDQLTDADSVALLLTCGPDRPELQKLYANQEVIRQALDQAAVSYERADLAAQVQQAKKLLSAADAPNKEIYVVTDMQVVSWEGLPDVAPQTAEDHDRPIPVVLVDVHGERLPNVALNDIEISAVGPVAGVPTQVKVTVQGDAILEQRRHIALWLDGKETLVSPTLTLPPGTAVDHVFHIVLEQTGLHRGEVRLVGQDACDRDDRLYFALSVNPHIPTAIIRPRDHEIPYLEDSYYLERALVPVTSENWAISTSRLLPPELNTEPLSKYEILFCVNLPALELAAAQRLRDYVRQGGHLVWISGDNMDPVLYDAMNESVGGDLLPLRLLSIRDASTDQPDGWQIGWMDLEHPALKPLALSESLYQSVLVYRYLEMAEEARERVRVLARLTNGAPWLVEYTVGNGSVLYCSTSAHVDWSNLPLRPLFLPLLARLTFYLAGAEAAQPAVTAGRPLVVPVSGAAMPTIQVKRPSGELERHEWKDDTGRAYRYVETHEVGVYELQIQDVARREDHAFAVNPDTDEFDSRAMAAEALKPRLGPMLPLVVCDDPARLIETIRKLREGESLWELFLIGLLLLLITEVFVANRKIDSSLAQQEGEARRLGTVVDRRRAAGELAGVRRRLPDTLELP